MAINEIYTGESVYTTSGPIDARSMFPMYQAVVELVERYSNTGQILDLGCSDGVATHNLSPDYTVYGFDLSRSALTGNHGQVTALADMHQLPLARGTEIDTVLMLDILEHGSWSDSVSTLEQLKSTLKPDHTAIVSMPVISPIALETWRELAQVARAGRRPEMGLFDRTHQILGGLRAHKRLFEAGGYEVAEEYRTTQQRFDSVTGNWRFKPTAGPEERPELAGLDGFVRTKRVAQMMLRTQEGGRAKLLYNETQSATHPRLAKLMREFFAYQGLYVLKPTPLH